MSASIKPEILRKRIRIQILSLLLFIGLAQSVFSQKLYWIRAEGGERNEYVFFRKEFQLQNEAQRAEIHLYVDSRYNLYVNGHYLGFGPVRSYHAHPYFDTYDLLPFLKKGKNVITVLAMNNGMETFQLFDNKGAALFWGEILAGSEKISLDIKSWKAKKSAGYDQTTPRFSFAKGPIESWDVSKDKGWNTAGTSSDGWQTPVPVANHANWGQMAPRPIPYLTKEDVRALRVMGAYPLKNEEDIYTFRVPAPDLDIEEYSIGHPGLAYTYIYSPKKQKVNAGLWWGEYFLNGNKINPKKTENVSYHRQEFDLELNPGWNELLVRNKVIWGTWDFYLSIPSNLGLAVSPSKKMDDADWFHSFVPLESALEKEIDKLDLKIGIEKAKENFPNQWRSHNRQENTNPAKDLAWMEADLAKPLFPSSAFLEPLIFEENPTGICFFFDMGEMQLGQFFVEGDFPEGSMIDIGFSEELNQEGLPWLYKRHQVGAGLRFVADGDQKRYQSFKPYGARYLKVTVRNNQTPFRLENIGMIRQVYPFETLGSFSSSDPLLDRIWEASWRTLLLCAEDSYTDTPFRERGLYAGDMIPQMAITQAVSGDLRLVKHSLNLFQDMYRPQMWEGAANRHEDYVFSSLIALDEYAKLSGDWDFVKEHYKNYKSLIGQYQNRYENGLVKTDNVFIEWTTINKKDAVMTAFEALYYYSLQRLAEWANHFGFQQDKEAYIQEATLLKENVNSKLWDSSQQNYVDGIKAGSILEEKHITSTIWPTLMGVTEPKDQEVIIDWLKEEILDIGQDTRKEKISPYSSFYLFALLYKFEQSESVENFIRKHWGPMALHNDRPTIWENFDVVNSDIGTSSHAWSGHPLFFFATETLGVNLGFFKDFNPDLIEIQPQSEALSWAKGTVVHPLGPVEVDWRIEGENLFLNYSAPPGAKVSVKPKGKLGKLNLVLNSTR
ncbi:family 78 glycoside hydrolase catalytic domain [Aquiflexum gelatinilyticum]|uniref:Alpha-L-rhamnosidase n=1 Tax=Aquiflexum gelatinilyticum TaxID=2961943 RepID=A0A9X2P5U1_9BACT|nr:family 78 glycoside hydrolase catalytic domain [Aquiflexum gelatinilyticum]MCR9014205.1 hypothetical protein [Aquiflexum gelatinilyticum]